MKPGKTQPPCEPERDPGKRPARSRKTIGVLLQRNTRRFLAFVRRRRGAHRDGETADVVQDASANFLKKPRHFEGETHFRRLFRRFLSGALGDRRKRELAQRRAGEAKAEPIAESGLRTAGTGPSTAAERDEERNQLRRAVARLSPDYRQLIHSRIWQELEWSEIASRLGIESADAARMRYSRALRALEKEMGRLSGGRASG